MRRIVHLPSADPTFGPSFFKDISISLCTQKENKGNPVKEGEIIMVVNLLGLAITNLLLTN